MAPIFQRISLPARLFAAMVACVFLAQTGIAATHLTVFGQGAGFGAVCAPQDGAKDGSGPVAPPNRHCQAFCCILHDGALDAPPLRPVVSVALIFPSEAVSPRLKNFSAGRRGSSHNARPNRQELLPSRAEVFSRTSIRPRHFDGEAGERCARESFRNLPALVGRCRQCSSRLRAQQTLEEGAKAPDSSDIWRQS